MTTVPSGVENDARVNKAERSNIVAESDLQSALTGIENRLAEIKAQHQPDKDATRQESPTGVTDNEEYRSTLINLLSGAEKSLPEHLCRIVQPVSDEEYFAHVSPNDESNQEQLDDDDEASESSKEEEDLSLDEYDEEELLDREALERARELRTQVREAAERVRLLRDSVTQQAVDIAKKEVQLLVDQQHGVDTPFDPEHFESKFRRLEADESSEKKSAKLLEMEQSLAALLSSLDGMDSSLPGSIEALQETVETIEESLARQRGGVESLSQTERAIISRDNEGASLDIAIEQQAPVPPEKRLASFLRQN